MAIKHITKTKGDLGVGKVISDILSNNMQVCLPIGEHLPFDLIAVSETGVLKRIQIKYRKIVNGAIQVPLSTANSSGRMPYDLNMIDVFAIFCPDNEKIYYINVNEMKTTAWFSIRIEPSKNRQNKKIRLATTYEDINRIYK